MTLCHYMTHIILMYQNHYDNNLLTLKCYHDAAPQSGSDLEASFKRCTSCDFSLIVIIDVAN